MQAKQSNMTAKKNCRKSLDEINTSTERVVKLMDFVNWILKIRSLNLIILSSRLHWERIWGKKVIWLRFDYDKSLIEILWTNTKAYWS